MTPYTHLTNKEFLRHVTLRDDLTALEHELVDRLIRTVDELEDVESREEGET